MSARSILTCGLTALGLAADALLAPSPAAGQAGDAFALRDRAAAHVCLVTAENALGVPLAYASGFLFGEGKFAVTDLSSLAQPGVTQAGLRFRDGRTAVAKQFGMADPSIGLVVAQLDKPPPGGGGLSFSTADLSGGPLEATVVGWKWGQELDLTVGRITQPMPTANLAQMLGLDAPKAPPALLNIEGVVPDEATGAPVLDRGGAVLGVLLKVAGLNRPLVVPSALLRQALLASDRQLKPLSQLPKPYWPVATQPLPGKPVAPADFANAIRTIKFRSRCGKCDGKGVIKVDKIVGSTTIGGITKKIVRQEEVTCPNCRGEGVLLPEGFYAQYVRMAEYGTWMSLAGDVEPKARDAAFSNALDLLRAIGKVGRRYRDDLIKEAREELGKPAAESATGPKGVVVFAEVREAVDGPDGPYLIFSPHLSRTLLASKADRLTSTGEAQGGKPRPGQWIVLAGAAIGPVSLGDHKPVFVQPFAWADGPDLGGPRRPPPGPAAGPSTPATPTTPTPSTTPKPGSPSFFGL